MTINNHIFIIGYPRSGATWIGKLFDTCYNVKYLWEPEKGNFLQWDYIDKTILEGRINRFEPHVPILPKFDKGTIDTAVYKLTFPFLPINNDNMQTTDLEIRQKHLNAKVIHVVRNPVRWIASLERLAGLDVEDAGRLLELYQYKNEFIAREYHQKDWYFQVRHDDIVKKPEMSIKTLLYWAGLNPSDQLFDFLDYCHIEDRETNVHEHSCIMTSNSVLNRWRGMDKGVIKQAQKIARDSFLWERIK